MAQTQTTTETVEVQVEQGGLPQMHVVTDGTWTNQIFWLAVTFVALYIVVSRLVLPRITRVIEDRDEQIRSDLDKAEQDRTEANRVREQFEDSLANARIEAQKVIADAKTAIQTEIATATKSLDEQLDARFAKAEAEVNEARTTALAEVEGVAAEIAADMVSRLSGVTVDDAKLKDAVKAVTSSEEGAS